MLVSLCRWVLSFFVSIFVLFAALVVSIRRFKDREKRSPFECGFDPKGNARIPFSLRFFVLAVVFLVFDIEIALLMPLPLIVRWGIKIEVIIGGVLFIIVLILGLLHEWREGSLD